jgi:hypothetical protein
LLRGATAICSARPGDGGGHAIFGLNSQRLYNAWGAIGALAAVAIAAVISITFYDRFWYAPDDGAYAHVASRILQGEVLNGSVQDIHAGYINFVNAAALALFGLDLLSLRIPLAALGVIQGLIAYLLLRRSGVRLALAASIALTSLSFVQFLNPTAHWYCLFVVLLIPVVIEAIPHDAFRRLVALGFLVGLIAMFRQLTGLIVALAVFVWLLTQTPDARGQSWVIRGLLVAMALGVGTYVAKQADVATAVLFGAGPVALLLIAAWRVRVSLAQTLRLIAGLGLGVGFAILPLAVYHVANGSVATWLGDTVQAALEIPQFGFIEHQSYLSLATLVLPQLFDLAHPAAALNALFWLFLILIPALNGAILVWRMSQDELGATGADALAWLASFYTLVALHYQVPIYLFYVAGLNALALAALAVSARGRLVVVGVLLATSAVALYFHAGQPLARGVDGTLRGERVQQREACGMPRCSLQLTNLEIGEHREVVSRIEAHSPQAACILVLPSDAELYFITGRCNPTRFFNSALGLRSAADESALAARLRRRPPAVLIHRPGEKYDTALTRQLVSDLRPLYRQQEKIGRFIVYWDRGGS